MESSFQGLLSEMPMANLIAGIGDLRLSGLLRLRQDETAKTIYFEHGAPVFAASDLPEEQLENRLPLAQISSAELIYEARRRSLTPHELCWNLVELGALSQEVLEGNIRQLATDIILSVFEWTSGEYTFYEDSELGLYTKLDWTPEECVQAATRRAASIESAVAAVPITGFLVPTGISTGTGPGEPTLSSTEAYVLASITTPTRFEDVAASTGLPQAEVQSAVSVLLGLGLLGFEEEAVAADSDERVHDIEPDAVEAAASNEASDGGSTGVSVEWVEELVARKLNSVAARDYYGVLGVDRIAPTSKITASYQKTRQTFDSFRTSWPDRPQLTERIDSLLIKIEEAHATLSDPARRRAYDQPSLGAAARPSPNGRSAAVPASAPAGATRSSVPSTRGTGPLVQNVAVARVTKPDYDPIGLANENYRRGRGRFDRNDFHTAVHHFREAVKLDATQSRYHYYLGVTLMILAQARKAAHSHTHDVGCHVTCSLGGGLARNPRLRHEAEQHMLRAAELDRSNPEIRLTLARIYQEAGMEKKAGHYYLETLMIDASNAAALKALGIFDKPPQKRLEAARRLAQ